VMDHGHLMALDTPRALVHGLGADAHVSFTLSAPLPLQELCGLDGVTTCAAHDGEGYSIVADNAQRAVVSLLDLAAARGLTIENLDVQGANLEDVFLRMTGRKLAEEDEEDDHPEAAEKPRRRGLFFGGGG
jgi:ABC-2 type transport system ATP-binding protein